MRVIIQRVKRASVIINKTVYSNIDCGLLCYVGFCDTDSEIDFQWVLHKLKTIKFFKGEKSLEDVKGKLLIVSQFTLFARIKKGTKPSWSKAASPELAKSFYNHFIDICKIKFLDVVETGVFGEEMVIDSINDGPYTLFLDTKNKE